MKSNYKMLNYWSIKTAHPQSQCTDSSYKTFTSLMMHVELSAHTAPTFLQLVNADPNKRNLRLYPPRADHERGNVRARSV